MTQTAKQMPGEANHAYFFRLASLPEDTTAHILARLLCTTVEDIMCAQGSWRDELAQRATECLSPDERLKRAAPKLLEEAQKLLSILGAAKILDGSDGYNVKAMMQMGHLKAACAAAKGE